MVAICQNEGSIDVAMSPRFVQIVIFFRDPIVTWIISEYNTKDPGRKKKERKRKKKKKEREPLRAPPQHGDGWPFPHLH